jgi:hypothetical protein
MFCKNCGKKVETDSKFCTSCGNSIENESLKESTHVHKEKNTIFRKSKIVFIAFIIFVFTFKIVQLISAFIVSLILNGTGTIGPDAVQTSLDIGNTFVLIWAIFIIQKTYKKIK